MKLNEASLVARELLSADQLLVDGVLAGQRDKCAGIGQAALAAPDRRCKSFRFPVRRFPPPLGNMVPIWMGSIKPVS